MKRVVVFILSLMMIVSLAPLPETAYAAQEADTKPIETAADFFQYVRDHELDENGETLGHGVVAFDVLNDTTYGGSWNAVGTGTEMDGKRFASYTYIGSDTDATSIDNMMKALDILEECNRLRVQEGLPELMVSDLGMAVGMVNANWSAAYYNLTHTLQHAANANSYQQYRWAENIAMGYSSVDAAFRGWYWQEKANYLGKSVTDNTGRTYTPEKGGQTGHYLNIIDSSYIVTGAGYSENAGVPMYAQEFKYQNKILLPYASPFGELAVREVGETGELYTVAEYRARLQAAIDDAAKPDDTPQLDPERYNRIAGDNRYETAVKVADQIKLIRGEQYFSTIIVACGDNYADALSGGYLAKVKQAPILLTNKYNEAYVTDYIQKNLREDGTVYLLGGTGVVSQKLENGHTGRSRC